MAGLFRGESDPFVDHPENDLRADADYSNRPRPQPRSFDELADEPDPAEIAEANRRSSRQAWIFLFAVLISSAVVAGVLGIVFRSMGGPLCEAGEAIWLCTPNAQLIWGIAALTIPTVGMLAAGFIMLSKYRRYLRWRTWMGVFYMLVPHSLFGLFNGIQMIYASTLH